MMLSEATNRLRKNADEWYKVRDKLKDTKSVKEIDKDYEAIEILLWQTRLDFESWSYDELVGFGKYISTIKREKYRQNPERKIKEKEYRKKYKEEHLEEIRERDRKQARKYRAEHLEEIREKDRQRAKEYREKNKEEYNRKNRERRRRKKRENEKVIVLSNKVATKHTNTSCLFDVSQLWNTYEHDYS